MGNSATTGRGFGAKTTTEESCLGVDLTGQLAIVTGCSAGIGIATVRQLVKQGCTVVMANRNQEKSKRARDTIVKDLESDKTNTDNNNNDNNNDNNNKDSNSGKTDDAAAKTGDSTDATTGDADADAAAAAATKDDTESKEDTTNNNNNNNNDKDSNISDRLILMQLDLSSLESVRNFVSTFVKHPIVQQLPLRFLINNAGVMALANYTLSKDGYELQFATNVLGHYYLTLLLLDYFNNLQDSDNNKSKGYYFKENNIRIINVSSSAHGIYPKDFKEQMENGIKNKDGPSKEKYSQWPNYGISKAGNVLFTKELVKRYSGDNSGIYSYSLHPGFILTELARDVGSFQQKLIRGFGSLVAKTIPQGAATTIYVACEDIDKLENGGFHQDCKNASNTKLTAAFRKDAPGLKELQETLWQWCDVLIKKQGHTLSLSQPVTAPVVDEKKNNNDDNGNAADATTTDAASNNDDKPMASAASDNTGDKNENVDDANDAPADANANGDAADADPTDGNVKTADNEAQDSNDTPADDATAA